MLFVYSIADGAHLVAGTGDGWFAGATRQIIRGNAIAIFYSIPRSVKDIGNVCFSERKSLLEITFEGEPQLGESVFDGCPLKCVNASNSSLLNYSFPVDCVIIGME
jgi:hypothetical protein